MNHLVLGYSTSVSACPTATSFSAPPDSPTRYIRKILPPPPPQFRMDIIHTTVGRGGYETVMGRWKDDERELPGSDASSKDQVNRSKNFTAGMGNGAKAQQKRERNAAKAPASGKSTLKTNEAAKSIVCSICRQTFLVTARAPQLIEHVENKHSGKTPKECFPTFAFP